MTFPMLADFALRMSCGLSALLLLTPWRLVPPAFFRTHSLVILGLLVLAALDATRVGVGGAVIGAVVVAAVLAYLATVGWGLGWPGLGMPLTLAAGSLTAVELVSVSRVADPGLWALNGAGRLSSAFLMGSTLTAMLLGHHYLTAPAMSIEPLKRFIRCMGCGLVARAALAAVGSWIWVNATEPTATGATVSPLFLAVRWGVGILGTGVAAWMTWETVKIRSTQSATGILYIALALVLFGELTAMALSRDVGVLF